MISINISKALYRLFSYQIHVCYWGFPLITYKELELLLSFK